MIMRRIVLCGATICETGNYGDDLLQELLEDKIYEVVPDAYIEYIDRNHYLHSIIRAIYRSDAFIYVPGGYLGYIEKWYSGSKRKTFQRFKYYYLPGLLYKISKKPMALIGQGIGPYEYRFLSGILASICNYSKLTVVRENTSHDLLRKSGVKGNIEITADCAQVICNRDMIYETKESNDIKKRFSDKKKIYILDFASQNWGDRIFNALLPFISDERYAFVIGTDGKEYNREELIEFSGRFPRERTYVYNYRDTRQLLSILNEVDVIITPKLHTAITGCTLGKSVIEFSVQYDKTKLYFEKIGYPERVFDYYKIGKDEMTEVIRNNIDIKIELPNSIREEAERNFELLEHFLKEYVANR